MAAALVITVLTTKQRVESASDTVLRGQADVFLDGIRLRLRQLRRAPSDEDLKAIYEELRGDGLRYLASFDRDGHIAARAGEPLGDDASIENDFATIDRDLPVRRADRARTVTRSRRRRSRRRSRRYRNRIGVLIDFQPRVADELRSAATRTLTIGGLAAAALLIAGIVLMRWFIRREAMQRDLERKKRLATLGQMSAILAHEIRNPLASLKGNSQLLARMLPEGDKPRAKADRVVAEAQRLEALTNDLLEFARSAEIEREPADPTELVREAAAHLEDRVVIDDSAAPERWSLDRHRFGQVVTNLLDNAAQASDEPVEARIAEDRGQLLVTVRDHGPGIASDDLPHLFEPFFTKRNHGTGLGLAVVQRLVELHNGTVTAENAADGGAVFRVRIPPE
jgi:two-component system sensor histidine kinase HydH